MSNKIDLFLKEDIQESERGNLLASLEKLEAFSNDTELESNNENNVNMDIILKIIRKNIEKSISYVKILGRGDEIYLVSSRLLCLQNHGLSFQIKDISYSIEHMFFQFIEGTLFRSLFHKDYFPLTLKCYQTVGNPHEVYHNINGIGIYSGENAHLDDITQISPSVVINYIKGVVIKIEKIKERIILKLLDSRNLIDTFKLFIVFKNENKKNDFLSKLKLNILLKAKDGIKQSVSRKLKIVFWIQNADQTDLKMEEQKIDFAGMSLQRRIQENPGFSRHLVSQIIDLQPQCFHRGLIILSIRVVKVLFAELSLVCLECKKKANVCYCETETNRKLNCFVFMVIENSGTTLYSKLKKYELFEKFFELADQEKETIMNYLRINGELKYSFGENLSNNSKSMYIKSSIDKLVGEKLVYGIFQSKVEKNNVQTSSSVGLYPNGVIKDKLGNTFRIFDFKIKYIDTDKQQMVENKFNYFKNKLLIE